MHRHALPLPFRSPRYDQSKVVKAESAAEVAKDLRKCHFTLGYDTVNSAADLQRGFARLNSSLAAWTRRRPGSTAEQRVPFSKRLTMPSAS